MNAIEFNHVSKQYRLGLVSTQTLAHDIRRFWITNVLRKEDPYLRVGETNDRASKGRSEYVWALRDIDFKVEQGDVVGIIGKNGAGKSTLLKLLSRVTGPTTGTIRAHGRIGSLLEVGTGFHPEMTGRENIFMNGAILGMSRSEIQAKLDEIIAFSGCERYIDTPVKRYSSGMTVRLGFAVAAFLEPEILVVDEVLAVGDAEFQKKAIGKMKDVSEGEGRTVLFVSHNMASVKALCNHGVLLEQGTVKMLDTINHVVATYLDETYNRLSDYVEMSKSNRQFETSRQLEIVSARLLSPLQMSNKEDIELELKIKRNDPDVKRFTIEMMIDMVGEKRVGSFISPLYSVPDKSEFSVHLRLANHNLSKGKYSLNFNVGIKLEEYGITDYDIVYNTLVFDVEYADAEHSQPLKLWRADWGACNFQSGKVEII